MLIRRWRESGGEMILLWGLVDPGIGIGKGTQASAGDPRCVLLGCSWAESSGWGVPFQYLQVIPEGEDIYDRCLTQAEIQGNINKVNGEQSCGFPRGGSPELIGVTMVPQAAGESLPGVVGIAERSCLLRPASDRAGSRAGCAFPRTN